MENARLQPRSQQVRVSCRHFCEGRGWLTSQDPGAGLRLPAPGFHNRKGQGTLPGWLNREDLAVAFPSVNGTLVHEPHWPWGLTNWGLCCEGLWQLEKGAS